MGFFERLYHIFVATCAASLLLVIVFGTIFMLIGGLLSEGFGVDLFGAVSEAFQDLSVFLRENFGAVLADIEKLWTYLWDLFARWRGGD